MIGWIIWIFLGVLVALRSAYKKSKRVGDYGLWFAVALAVWMIFGAVVRLAFLLLVGV